MPRRQIICEVDSQIVSDETCLDCAKNRLLRVDREGKKRHCQYPYPYIAACVAPNASRKGAGISATRIGSSCIRKSVWEDQYDYAQYPHEMQAALKGTAFHNYLEQFNEEGVLAEVRLAKRMPSGRVITGQIDRFLPKMGRIEDYKCKSEDHAIFTKPPFYYVVQLNIYRYFLVKGCVIYETGEVLPPQEVKEMILFPSNHKEWGEVPVPIWPLERTEWLIEETLNIFGTAQADAEYLPPRVYSSPETTGFCMNYCPFWRQCRTAGGETRDLLVEAVQRK